MKSEKKKRWTQCLLSLFLYMYVCVCALKRLCQQRRKKSATYKLCLFIYYIFETAALNYATFCPKLSPLRVCCCCCCCHRRTLSTLSWPRPGVTMLSLLLLCSLTFSLFLFFINLAKERWKNTLYKCCWQRTATAERGLRTKDRGQRTVGQGIADVPHS